ncbi:MAG: hypothetical protein HQK56_16025 [Deltaproteobacteria bacterium]|nr:hypothetical protein [Deltaproteobacteria bacterium]
MRREISLDQTDYRRALNDGVHPIDHKAPSKMLFFLKSSELYFYHFDLASFCPSSSQKPLGRGDLSHTPEVMPMQVKTFEHIKGSELPASLLEKFGFSPDQILNVTFEVVEPDKNTEEVRAAEIEEGILSLKMAMQGMEDEDEPEYTLADLKERWN